MPGRVPNLAKVREVLPDTLAALDAILADITSGDEDRHRFANAAEVLRREFSIKD